MVDDLDLAIHEKLSVITGNDTQAEIIRLARRYLALRENKIAILQAADIGFCAEAYRAAHDAAADRLLEGGK